MKTKKTWSNPSLFSFPIAIVLQSNTFELIAVVLQVITKNNFKISIDSPKVIEYCEYILKRG